MLTGALQWLLFSSAAWPPEGHSNMTACCVCSAACIHHQGCTNTRQQTTSVIQPMKAATLRSCTQPPLLHVDTCPALLLCYRPHWCQIQIVPCATGAWPMLRYGGTGGIWGGMVMH